MIRAGLSDDSRRMIRAKMGMIRASEIFRNVFVEVGTWHFASRHYLLIIQLC